MKNINEITQGVTTGFAELDDLMKGMRDGELVLIGGRPAMGKTSFALSIVNNLSIKKGIPCLYYSFETSKERIENILQYISVDDVCEKMSYRNAPIYIEDDNSITMEQFCSMARAYKEKHNISLIVIDYFQIMNYESVIVQQTPVPKERAIDLAIDCLKELAIELDIPIVLLSQLTRNVEKRENKRPIISDLSYITEDKLNTIIFIYREQYYDKNTTKPNIAEMIVAKNGNGDIGTATVGFEAGRFFKKCAGGYIF